MDTREHTPFTLTGFDTVRRKLETGDYSLEGYEHLVAVERKSKADAYGCVGAGRERFTACLERLSLLARAAIVIESGLSEFSIPPARTRITAAQAVGSYIAWSCEYQIPIFWCDGGHLQAERVTVRFLAAYLKHVEMVKPHSKGPAITKLAVRDALADRPTGTDNL